MKIERNCKIECQQCKIPAEWEVTALDPCIRLSLSALGHGAARADTGPGPAARFLHTSHVHKQHAALSSSSACHVITRPGSWTRPRHQIRTQARARACELVSGRPRRSLHPISPQVCSVFINSWSVRCCEVWSLAGLELL